jgi:hypothetical protein
MDYPTMDQVESANREQIYRWFLCLPIPRLIRVGKGKNLSYVYDPQGVREIFTRIYVRWKELGGPDGKIRNKVLREEVIKQRLEKVGGHGPD